AGPARVECRFSRFQRLPGDDRRPASCKLYSAGLEPAEAAGLAAAPARGKSPARRRRTMLLTAWCVLAVLGGSLLLGIPLAWLLNGRRPLGEGDWVLAPFLGLAGAMLVLHNLVYLGCTVARATPWLWAGAAALWLWMLRGAGARAGLRPLRGSF